jgi:hypothetical protein
MEQIKADSDNNRNFENQVKEDVTVISTKPKFMEFKKEHDPSPTGNGEPLTAQDAKVINDGFIKDGGSIDKELDEQKAEWEKLAKCMESYETLLDGFTQDLATHKTAIDAGLAALKELKEDDFLGKKHTLKEPGHLKALVRLVATKESIKLAGADMKRIWNGAGKSLQQNCKASTKAIVVRSSSGRVQLINRDRVVLCTLNIIQQMN